ncbi:MAG: putative N-acetyltransferase [Candidatus Peregrinibacteria bacterium Greene0416_62]|nr:MAG: putative N-acetyltransferase [Candidatus Peregrinibacteria bacterium Greene0416_62]TSC97485.1 MAG: putative N-acetyltransferase [Candidatus Peregrinibacteria bacterium Greene1014_49]
MDFSRARLAFESPRLTLRIMEDRDATEEYAGWLNDPEVNRYLATKSATIKELQDYIQKKDLQADALFFGVYLKSNGAHIGTVKLEPIEPAQKRATIAVMIGNKMHWGKGYAAEAMKLLMDWCFNELKFDEVNLGVIAKNAAAIRAYEKLGFVETKREIAYVRYGDELHDHVLMAVKKRS